MTRRYVIMTCHRNAIHHREHRVGFDIRLSNQGQSIGSESSGFDDSPSSEEQNSKMWGQING